MTVMLLEETPTVLSLGKLCEDHGFSYHWTSGQKPHLTKKGRRELRTIRCPWSIDKLFKLILPTSPTSSSQAAAIPTQHPALTRSESVSDWMEFEETRRVDQQKAKTQIKMTTKEYGKPVA